MCRLVYVVVALVAVGCGHKDSKELPRAESPRAEPPRSAPSVPAPKAAMRDSAATAEFWTWFAGQAAVLANDHDLAHATSQINDHLGPGHPGIFAEVAAEAGARSDQRTLVLTADGNKERFPTVQAIYRARPTVAGWKIVAFRQRDTGTITITMDGVTLDRTKMTFVAKQDGDKLSITVYVPDFARDRMTPGLFIVLDHTLGEYDMETHIGGIDLEPIENAPATAQPLLALPALIDKTFPK
jgi:hypothetical protein